MKLSEILSELQGSSRRATLNISAFDLINTMEKVEQMGIPVDRYDGPTPDGKTYLEYTVYPEGKDKDKLDQAFTVYDYKFGEDPTDEENYQKEYPFSVGARARVGIINASNLGLEISGMREEAEDVNEAMDKATKLAIEDEIAQWRKGNLSKAQLKKSLMDLSDGEFQLDSIKGFNNETIEAIEVEDEDTAIAVQKKSPDSDVRIVKK